jgi:hypothetical protein
MKFERLETVTIEAEVDHDSYREAWRLRETSQLDQSSESRSVENQRIVVRHPLLKAMLLRIPQSFEKKTRFILHPWTLA